MTAPHETAYPRLKQDPTARELEQHYTPSADELSFVQALSKQPAIRLAVMLHLRPSRAEASSAHCATSQSESFAMWRMPWAIDANSRSRTLTITMHHA